MAIKYFKIQSKANDVSYESDRAFRFECDTTEEHAENNFITQLQQKVIDSKIVVEEQYFKSNATYHKLNFLKQTDLDELQNLLNAISSFDLITINEITSTDFTDNMSGSSISESFSQYTEDTKIRKGL